MSLIDYGAVARKDTILAQFANVSGSFDVSSASILKKLNTKDDRYSCEKDGQKFYIYHDEETNLNFIVVGSLSLEANQAYNFLDKIKRDFYQRFNKSSWENAKPYGLQNEFSSQIKNNISIVSRENKVSQIQNNLLDTQEQMTQNIKSVMLRGRELEDLDEGAVSLQTSSRNFERQARSIRRRMCWQEYRWYILAGIIALFIIIIIIIICTAGKKK